MYNKILVTLDGSERAEAILEHIEDIAQRYKASVILLSVIEPLQTVVSTDGIYIPSEDIVLEHQQAVQNYLTNKQTQLQKHGIKTKISLTQGRVVDEIINVAGDEDVDLVAMTSHGRTGLSRVFYGSIAAGVLHRIDRPLLLIRAK